MDEAWIGANEPACKPDSVLASEGRSSIWDAHCCAPRATYPLTSDEQPVSADPAPPRRSDILLVLLPVGFT